MLHAVAVLAEAVEIAAIGEAHAEVLLHPFRVAARVVGAERQQDAVGVQDAPEPGGLIGMPLLLRYESAVELEPSRMVAVADNQFGGRLFVVGHPATRRGDLAERRVVGDLPDESDERRIGGDPFQGSRSAFELDDEATGGHLGRRVEVIAGDLHDVASDPLDGGQGAPEGGSQRRKGQQEAGGRRPDDPELPLGRGARPLVERLEHGLSVGEAPLGVGLQAASDDPGQGLVDERVVVARGPGSTDQRGVASELLRGVAAGKNRLGVGVVAMGGGGR